jgi:hypothetical protein
MDRPSMSGYTPVYAVKTKSKLECGWDLCPVLHPSKYLCMWFKRD